MGRFVFLLTIVALIACTKSDSIPEKTTREILVGKKWKLSGMTIQRGNGTMVPDAYSALPAHEKDDYFLYKSDSTYELNDNLILKDSATSKILDAGNWELITGSKFLKRHSTVFVATYEPSEIKELSETKLHLETRYPGDGSIIWTTYTPF